MTASSPPGAAGIDGCRAGWVVATDEGVRVEATFADAVAGARPAAVDMPIGLLEAPGPRACDQEARRLLSPRGATVFGPPARPQLGAASFADVAGVSLQAFHLRRKLAEVDAWMTPARQRRVREAHPELAFLRLHGAPLPTKRTPEGARVRMRLLGLREVPRVPGARSDDVLDALALLGTARRIAERRATRLGGARDARGLAMEILY